LMLVIYQWLPYEQDQEAGSSRASAALRYERHAFDVADVASETFKVRFIHCHFSDPALIS
jgi:hypothetical protein